MTKKKNDVAPTWHGAEKLRALLDPIESLRLDEKNARLHDNRSITAVRASLTRFGQRKPIVVRDGVVIAGNGTLQAARLEGWTHIATVDADGLTDEQVRAYAIADNRTAELSSWDYGVLHAEMTALSADIPTIDLGWTPAELKAVEPRNQTDDDVDCSPQLTGREYRVVIDKLSETEQAKLIEQLEAQGYACKAMIT
jgi:hypothetical protein